MTHEDLKSFCHTAVYDLVDVEMFDGAVSWNEDSYFGRQVELELKALSVSEEELVEKFEEWMGMYSLSPLSFFDAIILFVFFYIAYSERGFLGVVVAVISACVAGFIVFLGNRR